MDPAAKPEKEAPAPLAPAEQEGVEDNHEHHDPAAEPPAPASNDVNHPKPEEGEAKEQQMSESKSEVEEKEEVIEDCLLNDLLKINKTTVDFGDLFPGQIVEETIIISNTLLRKKIPFKIKVNCLSHEFDDLDEYVYSMRRPSPNEVFNYNDTFLILLAPKTMSSYKLAIKVPTVRNETEILGNIEISSNETKPEIITIPIRSKVILPVIRCEKMIYLNSLKMSVLKLFMKNTKRQEFRISLKNMAKQAITVEFQIMKHEKYNHLDFTFYPPSLNLSPSLSSNYILNVKSNLPDNEKEDKEVKCVLLVKMKNGSPIFAYPVVIVFGE